jgi:hypothetical protein
MAYTVVRRARCRPGRRDGERRRRQASRARPVSLPACDRTDLFGMGSPGGPAALAGSWTETRAEASSACMSMVGLCPVVVCADG